MSGPAMRYILSHQASALGVAYFSPEPHPAVHPDELLKTLATSPSDGFLRAHARKTLANLPAETLRNMFADANSALQSLILETVLLTPALSDLWQELSPELNKLASESPHQFLASVALVDHDTHSAWSLVLSKNIFEHQSLSDLQLDALPQLPHIPIKSHNTDVHQLASKLPTIAPLPRRAVEETYQIAQERLYGLGVLVGPEMRHHASLSPWGLLRQWHLDRTVLCGAVSFRLEGNMTSYGRGLHLADARASLAMEIVERYSSFADIRNMRISGTSSELTIGTLSELSTCSTCCLDPNLMRLEVPYHNQAVYWLEGMSMAKKPCLIPVQAVYLFSNLDESQLFTGLGSTGLASGNTPEEAKVSGLLEVVERDSEAVHVFDWNQCFRLTSDDQEVNDLLEKYRAQGIDPIFQDLTTELGVPCYKCFVLCRDGLVKATGASLSGARAVISALTETPFPFPGTEPSRQGPDLPVRQLENLPDYSTGSAAGDLQLLEAILEDQELEAYYVDLTKREMRLPVFRSIVPGLEIVSDFDRFTRISPRLMRNVIKARKKE